jgi:hypothetical protein
MGTNILEKRVASIFGFAEQNDTFQKIIILIYTAENLKPQMDDDITIPPGRAPV